MIDILLNEAVTVRRGNPREIKMITATFSGPRRGAACRHSEEHTGATIRRFDVLTIRHRKHGPWAYSRYRRL